MLMSLSDKDKIDILKATNVLSITALVVTNIAGKIVLNAYNKRERQIAIAQRMLERFIELSPESVSAQIMNEFQFEWVTKDLDPPKFPKDKL
jgi:hypothetical protein